MFIYSVATQCEVLLYTDNVMFVVLALEDILGEILGFMEDEGRGKSMYSLCAQCYFIQED